MDSNNVKKPNIFILEHHSCTLVGNLKLSFIGNLAKEVEDLERSFIGNHSATGNSRTYKNNLLYYVTKDSSQEGRQILLLCARETCDDNRVVIFDQDDQKKFVMNLIKKNIDLYIEPVWKFILQSDIMNLIKDQEIAEKVNFKIMNKDGQIYDLNLNKLEKQNYIVPISFFEKKESLMDYAIYPNQKMNEVSNDELSKELKK